ncbi:AMP-binding protein [Microbulbifer variabilis]|uniref:AMP-binding protein n=1 Tax=Microbulbifer variabilis TaxID=266805 RepID=A0ABY4V8Q9_9GAMM|nr:AMP-binding protein [Microbulbifer variabilis]USD19613.1 AMP-binding protein [Microbulbifer variabilis]
MTIGHLDWSQLLHHARSISEQGGLSVPPNANRIEDLPISGPKEILKVTKALAKTEGAILMSSGGTTGNPKLAYTPFHQATQRLLQQWKPLGPGDVLLNLFNPGRLWGAHYFIQTLAEKSRAITAPVGPFTPTETGAWLETFRKIEINALAGAPTGLADFAQGILDGNCKLNIKTIIWMAEPWTEKKFNTVRMTFPNAGFWCDYGSVETNSIAVNEPECDRDTYHLLADQLIEPDDHGALLTRIGDGWTVPVIRYRLGDLIRQATCPCGQPNALLIEGRADDDVSLCSAILSVRNILAIAREEDGVEEAQLILTKSGETRKSASELTLAYTGITEPDIVRKRILVEIHNLASVVQQYPGAFSTKRVERLMRVKRTNKVPPIIQADDINL